MIKYKKGFTLIELLVVISIIGVLSSVVLSSLRSARDKAIAVKFVADFNAIAKGWALWQADTGSNFLEEDDYNTVGGQCKGKGIDEPVISDTDLYINKSGIAGWNGHYISGIKDPFGNEYLYDNDKNKDTLDYSDACLTCGVNIFVFWCSDNSGYLRVIPLIDKIIDGGNGRVKGKFVWGGTDSFGGYMFNIAKNSSE